MQQVEEHDSHRGLTITNDRLALREKLENLPANPGIYQFLSVEGEVLYIGKAINLRNRVRSYFQKSYRPDPRREAMVSKIADLEVIVTDSEVEALILETTLIQKFKPRYNIDLKDDKSFPYIVVTNEPYPRVFATRRVIRDGSKYFGPYTEVKNMHASLKMIREIYRVRSCNYFIDDEVIEKKKIKVCFDFHIKKCDGPCEGLISQEQYLAMIGEVTQVLKGKTASLVESLEAKMNALAEEMRFEEAAELRDKIRQLSVYTRRQKIVDWEMVDRDLFALASEADDACGVVFKIRDGKIIGRQHFYMSGVGGRNEAEVIEQLLERYYLDTEEIPREVYLPVEVEHEKAIAEWLGARRGERISITVPKIGEKAKLMAMCRSNAQFLLDMLKVQQSKRSDFIPPPLKSLQRDLRLAEPPRKIECFDISNIQGSDTVGSMVVFIDGRPKKSEYRKFRIRTAEGPDDFASMREVIERRYTKVMEEHLELPDLIVVDGGKGQLSAAVQVLERLGLRRTELAQPEQGSPSQVTNVPIIGLAKRLEEVFVPGASDPQSIPRSSSGLKLLQQIRDEAHRFAVTYHRTLRKKRTLQTELDLIEGIGKKRARQLLDVFGSVQGVKFASVEQLSEVVGNSVAAKIRQYFTDGEADQS
jgi:excinuclease ABC subunit C